MNISGINMTFLLNMLYKCMTFLNEYIWYKCVTFQISIYNIKTRTYIICRSTGTHFHDF